MPPEPDSGAFAEIDKRLASAIPPVPALAMLTRPPLPVTLPPCAETVPETPAGPLPPNVARFDVLIEISAVPPKPLLTASAVTNPVTWRFPVADNTAEPPSPSPLALAFTSPVMVRFDGTTVPAVKEYFAPLPLTPRGPAVACAIVTSSALPTEI